jgi:hypothetical protein
MKPTAWYDPSNGVVSTDQDCPLFTPLGQVWPLYPKGEWVGLTDKDKHDIELKAGITEDDDGYIVSQMFNLTEDKLKEKNA